MVPRGRCHGARRCRAMVLRCNRRTTHNAIHPSAHRCARLLSIPIPVRRGAAADDTRPLVNTNLRGQGAPPCLLPLASPPLPSLPAFAITFSPSALPLVTLPMRGCPRPLTRLHTPHASSHPVAAPFFTPPYTILHTPLHPSPPPKSTWPQVGTVATYDKDDRLPTLRWLIHLKLAIAWKVRVHGSPAPLLTSRALPTILPLVIRWLIHLRLAIA